MPNGILIIDKPAGWTSMDVCAKVRGIFHEKRVGHGGTLDPMATGVLPVFVGQATRAVAFAESGQKEYVAGLRLGLVTDTQDTTGDHPGDPPRHGRTGGRWRRSCPAFWGSMQQIPPMYSAIKVGGQKLYELARKGQEVERKPRRITIYELELLEQAGGTDYLLRCRCSKGTYIRTLCHDIGQLLGCGGAMYSPAAHHGRRVHPGPGGDPGGGAGPGRGPAAAHGQPVCRSTRSCACRPARQERRVRCGNPVSLPGTCGRRLPGLQPGRDSSCACPGPAAAR